MEASPVLFRDLTYIFLAAVAGGLLAWRFRLPLIPGFVVGGIVISPFTPGLQLSDVHQFEVFADVGVVLLMFSIGVEVSIPDLMRVKKVALVGALGAFLAGLSISGSEDLHQAHTQLVPLRDAFVALFFVSLGTLIAPGVLAHNLPLLGTMLLLIVFGKFAIWMIVVRLFRYPIATAIAVASGLTQIGELSFVLVKVAWSAGMVTENVFSATLAASLISILLNVFLLRGTLGWLGRKLPVAEAVAA